MTIYKITQTEVHHVSADSAGEAQDIFNQGTYDCLTSLNVEIVEADFKNEVSQLRPKTLQIEAPEWDNYPSKDEIVTTTFGCLKTVQNEEIIKGIQYAIDYLTDINSHTAAECVQEFLWMLTEASALHPIPEWQKQFFAEHPLYEVPTE
jgi:hypothetical protein